MGIPALREIVEERKEKAIEALSTSYAKNRLPLEEYERLVEYINKIESERELAVVEKIVAEYRGNDASDAEPAVYDEDEDSLDNYQHHQPGSSLTVLSSRTLQGPLKSGSQFVSFLGSTQIKIRKADLSKKRTFLQVVSILGDSEILVESGIRVINKAIPILGNSETKLKVDKQAQAGGPELVINGAALLGNITVGLLKE